MKRLAPFAAVALALCSASPARADGASEPLAKRARDLFRGAAACEEAEGLVARPEPDCRAQYRLAAAVYRRAYETEPLANYLFNLAQAERMAGDCSAAVSHYRAFVSTQPAASHREVAERQIAKCRSEPPAPLPSAAEATTGPPTPAAPAPPAPARPQPDRDDAPLVEMVHWQGDGWGHALLALGASGMVAGGVVVGVSYARLAGLERRAERGEGLYGEHVDDVKSLSTMRLAGWITLGAGGALALGALVRYLVVDGSLELRSASRRDGPRFSARVLPDVSGGGVGVADVAMTLRF